MHNFLYKSALAQPEDILPRLNEPGFTLLDASFAMPGSGAHPKETFEKNHIPGAHFFDIEAVADHETDLPHMLPSPKVFAAEMERLGIGNDDEVIIYGQSGIVMGPARAWWMFRVFGHNNVRVLDGGLPAWQAARYETTNAPSLATTRTPYVPRMHTELVRDITSIKNLGTETQLIDARAMERFSGHAAEPRAGLRSGHIPGSINLPCMQLVEAASGKLKPKDELEALFRTAGFTPEKPVITTCGSGVTACVLALALYELGYLDVPVYDGSWSEWGRDDSRTPVARSA